MTKNLSSLPSILVAAFAAVMAWATPAIATAADNGARILVARPELRDAVYGATILYAKSLPDGSSVGFILNRPTPMTLAQLFPEDKPAQKAVEPVFLGGPVETQMIVALVERSESPGIGCIQLAPELFLAVHRATVEQIIESEPNHARFYAGLVVWRPGELEQELKQGFWYEMEPDSRLIFSKKTDGMWQELVHRSYIAKNAI
jgi:putative transcriptional regulator